MKKVIVPIILTACCISFASCTKETDLSNEDRLKNIDTEFSFRTRTENTVCVKTINAIGESTANILFSIYTESPYETTVEGDDATRNELLKPIYSGYTDENGVFSKSILIPNGITELYVVPEYAGFGEMQKVSLQELANGVELKGKQITLSTTRAIQPTESIERAGTRLGTNTTFYHFFNDEEINLADGSLNVGKGLVSYENLSYSFIRDINSFFPESKNNYTGKEDDTDLKITSEGGSEIWITYIGDGGFTNGNQKVCNGLYYYTYTDANKPSKSYSNNYTNSSEYHLTAIFPNVHPSYISAGTKVQLLYWDDAKQMYVSTFPKGTYVGFSLNFYGYNPNKNVNKKGFALTKTDNNPYCSTKAFNADGKIHGVTHWDKNFSCYVIGMERAGLDNDFNDILAKISINEKQALTGEVEPPVEEEVCYSQNGILAFEDNWPYLGDYDFNDYVVEYTYTIRKKESSNKITGIDLTFTPRAAGGAKINGFGIQLPIERSNVSVLPQNVAAVENESKLTMVVYENVRNGFINAPDGFINTLKGSSKYESTVLNIAIDLKEPIEESSISFDDFNPFLFTSNRDHEIHLVNYKPTASMSANWFGLAYDVSKPSEGVYFRMDNNFPWALDISNTNWRWAYESLGNGIVLAYPNYSSWYTNWKEGNNVDWVKEMNEEYVW